jgi:hypothetical protein
MCVVCVLRLDHGRACAECGGVDRYSMGRSPYQAGALGRRLARVDFFRNCDSTSGGVFRAKDAARFVKAACSTAIIIILHRMVSA